LSGISSATLRRAIKIAPVDAVQVDYSPFVLAIEGLAGTDLLATCREFGVAVVAAMPLGRGMVTKTFADGKDNGDSIDKRPHVMPRFMKGNREKNVEIIGQFRSLAEKKGCTTSQLALAWLLKQGDDIIPIPGTKQLAYLEENCAAINVHLTDEDVAEVRQFVEAAEIAGHTLPAAYADFDFRNTAEEV
jgi:aryl-alcohol dehydrogenase-like predicted oxidoreductase